MFHDNFTATVAGNDLLAIIISIELALRKKKVCLIEPPLESTPPLYLRDVDFLIKKLNQIGLSQFETRPYFSKPDLFQILSPEFRFDCRQTTKSLLYEFEREFNENHEPHKVSQVLKQTPVEFFKRNYVRVRKIIERKHDWTEKLSYPFSSLPYMQNFLLFQKDGAYLPSKNYEKLYKKLRDYFLSLKGTIKSTELIQIKRDFEKWTLTVKSYEGTVFTKFLMTTFPLNQIKYEKRMIHKILRRGEYLPHYTAYFYLKKTKRPVGLKNYFLYMNKPQSKSLRDNVWCATFSEHKKTEQCIEVNFFSSRPHHMANSINEILHTLIPFSKIEMGNLLERGQDFYHSFSCERKYNRARIRLDKNWYHFGPETGAWLGFTGQLRQWETFKNEQVSK